MWVANFGAQRIFWNFQNAMPNRFGAAFGMQHAMAACRGDEGLWRCGSFDHFYPRPRLQAGEIFRSLTNILIRCDLCNGAHAVVFLANAGFVVAHLANDVCGRQAGNIGGFGMSLAGHQMAGAAGEADSLATSHGFGRGWMFIRKPVWRTAIAGDFCRLILFPAAGDRDDAFGADGDGLHLVRDIKRPVRQTCGNCERLLGVEFVQDEQRRDAANEHGNGGSQSSTGHGESLLGQRRWLNYRGSPAASMNDSGARCYASVDSRAVTC